MPVSVPLSPSSEVVEVGEAMSASAAPPPDVPFRMARLGRHTLVFGAATVLMKAVSFVMLPVYTRYLTPADYGVMQLIDMTLDVVSIIAGAQVALGIFRFFHKAGTDPERRSVVSTALLLLAPSYATVGFVTLAVAPVLSRMMFHSQAYVGLIRIAAASLALQGVIAAAMAYLRVRHRSMMYVGVNLAKLLVGLAFNVIFLVGLGTGVRGVFYSSLIANVLVAVVLGVMLLRDVGLTFSRPAARDLLRYGIPLIGTQFATFVATFGDRYFLQGVSNVTAVGIYALAYQFGFLLASLGYMPFEAVWAPARFEIVKRRDRDEVLSRGFIYMNLLLISSAVALTLFIGDILRIMTTPAFYGAAPLVPIILIAYVLQGWSGMQDLGILVRERTELVTLANWLAAIVAVIGYAVLIPRWLGLGAAVATVVAFGVRYGSVYVFSQKLWPVHYRWAPVIKQIVIALVICGAGFVTPRANVWFSLGSRALLFAVYLFALWVLVLSTDDRRAARVLFGRLRAATRRWLRPARAGAVGAAQWPRSREGMSQDEPKRILILESGAGAGGSSTFLGYFLAHLDRTRYEPFVAYYFQNDGPDTRRIRDLGVRVQFLTPTPEPRDYVPIRFLLGGSRWRLVQRVKVVARFAVRLALVDLPQLWRLRALIRRDRIDLVLLNNDVNYHLVGILGARIAGTPCLCRKSGLTPNGRLKRLLVPYVDLFLAISDSTARQQRTEYPGARVETVYAGIDLGLLDDAPPDPDIRRKLGVPDGKKLIGYVSRFQAGKGQSEFVEAAGRVLRHRDDVVFVIVGDEVGGEGELMRALRARVHDLGIERAVLFAGWRRDVPQVLSALDIFVHVPTTWGEGLGIANIEAMARGKPAVVSDNGGLADAVVDGVTGFIVPKGDVERLARAMERLLDDGALAARLGAGARARVEEKFDMRKNTREMERYFEQYLTQREEPAGVRASDVVSVPSEPRRDLVTGAHR